MLTKAAFDQKYSKIVKYYYNIKKLFPIVIYFEI